MSDEHEFLRQMLTDVEAIDNDSIDGALKAGLTVDDVEWNQRLDREWTFHPTDPKAESELRVAYFIENGLDEETARAHLARITKSSWNE